MVLERGGTMTHEKRRNGNNPSFLSRKWQPYLPRILLILGISLLVISVATGGAKVGLFFIIPFVVGTDVYSALGILFIILAFVLWFFLPFRELERRFGGGERGEQGQVVYGPMPPQHSARKKAGGVVFIGPIPIIFGSDPKTALWVAVAGFLILVVLLVLMFLLV